MNFLTILWSEETPDFEPFNIKEHETLQEAVMYLVKNGARYQNQEIVKKVDWLPNGSEPQKSVESPKNEDPGPPPGTINGPAEQPKILNDTARINQQNKIQKKTSIFDGYLPPQLIPMVQADS